MAGNEVVLQMEEHRKVVADQFGKPADGSDHMKALADLKSKFRRLENEEESESPLSSSVKPQRPLSSSVKPQCPMVPKRLRPDVKGAEDYYYAPKLISLGPYHHGKPHLKDGETLKLKLAEAYIQECEPTVDEIYNTISDSISYGHEDFNIRYQDISLLHQDALLLENQLPYQLLLELMKMVDPGSANDFWTAMFQEFFGISDESIFQEFIGMKKKESFLQKMKNYCPRLFLPINQIIDPKSKPQSPNNESKPCHHLLDLFRRNFLGDERSGSPTHPENENLEGPSSSETEIGRRLGRASVRDVKEVMASFRNVKELMDAGIRIKRSPTRHLRDISFRSNGITACLRIPPITIDNSTKAMFLNLIAYEMSSDVDHDFISYLRFLDSLIDHADDVKELQSIGILQNNLGTHDEVAQFFNTVSANLESNFHAYKDVRVKIRKHLQSHYNSKLTMWMTQCLDTYFGSPWTIIAWVGAALALFLTFVQTYFSVFPH
ncbi:hypothetical protein CK203_041018 [Vitis vinifera]|uniref:Uncharacterized protein n=1 Tax=Vitis vinifera TaxID=29760 RepID=A0A438H9U3_VITVI|nr:hypothetical protein CK203_041018 [Vitis vinifera]